MSLTAHAHPGLVPRGVLFSAGALIAFTIGATCFRAQRPTSATCTCQLRSLSDPAPRFDDGDDGASWIATPSRRRALLDGCAPGPMGFCAARCAASPRSGCATGSGGDAIHADALERRHVVAAGPGDRPPHRPRRLRPHSGASLRAIVRRQGGRPNEPSRSARPPAFEFPCTMEIEHTPESLHAHVEIDGDFVVEPGDEVLVHRRADRAALWRAHRRAPHRHRRPRRRCWSALWTRLARQFRTHRTLRRQLLGKEEPMNAPLRNGRDRSRRPAPRRKNTVLEPALLHHRFRRARQHRRQPGARAMG